jgi:outer membrane protein OmpA-like peptidoglycan-associated protein
MKMVRFAMVVAILALAGCAMMNKPSAPPAMPETYLVFFHEHGVRLTPDAQTIVGQAVAAVQQHHPSTVTVAGYTANIGTPAQNQALAEERVAMVRQAMVAGGVDPKLFLSIPLGPADDAAGKTGDSRVDIRLTYDK